MEPYRPVRLSFLYIKCRGCPPETHVAVTVVKFLKSLDWSWLENLKLQVLLTNCDLKR